MLKTPFIPSSQEISPNQKGTSQCLGVGSSSTSMFCGLELSYLSILVPLPGVGLVQVLDYWRYTANAKYEPKDSSAGGESILPPYPMDKTKSYFSNAVPAYNVIGNMVTPVNHHFLSSLSSSRSPFLEFLKFCSVGFEVRELKSDGKSFYLFLSL